MTRSPAIQQLTAALVTALEAHVIDRVNTRLRDVCALSMVKVPKRRGRPPGSKNKAKAGL